MQHTLEVTDDADALARRAAAWVAERLRDTVAARGAVSFAVSGGRTPWAMFAHLERETVPWEHVVLYQVDERVAPAGDPDRNLGHLRDALVGAPADLRPMPVEADDLAAACSEYAAGLPERFDLVHLGLGPDGHTASLVPGDPVLDVVDRLVATTGGTYQGRHRMTLTYPALARADQLLWLVEGAGKRGALEGLLAGRRDLPAGRVTAGASLIMADRAAAGPGPTDHHEGSGA